MAKISNKLAKAIKSQVIAYNAYYDGISNQQSNSVVVWATRLMEAQEVTGVISIDPDTLNEQIARYRMSAR